VFIYDTVCLKNSLYEFVSALFVQMLHYFCFTNQLALLRKSEEPCIRHIKELSQMHGFL